jgi:CrcB protein
MTKLLVVGIGGFLGAVARYAVSGWVQSKAGPVFPAGTLAVNVVGCLVLGAVMTIVETRSVLGPEARLFLTVGIVGSFTTFSTLGYETLELFRTGAFRLAIVYVAANLVVGLLAVWVGRTGARWLPG